MFIHIQGDNGIPLCGGRPWTMYGKWYQATCPGCLKEELHTLHPVGELHEDDGFVLAYRLDEHGEVCEPPVVVSILDEMLPWEDDDEERWWWSRIPSIKGKP